MIGDGFTHVGGAPLAAEIACAMTGSESPFDGRANHGGGSGDVEMVEHHGGTQDGCDGISDSLARDIGCRSMHRFEHEIGRAHV